MGLGAVVRREGRQALKLLDLAPSAVRREGTRSAGRVSSIGVNDAECGPRAHLAFVHAVEPG
jgi:hypothetical protein